MTVRDRIANHEPLEVRGIGKGLVVIAESELRELVDLAHEAICGGGSKDADPVKSPWEGFFQMDDPERYAAAPVEDEDDSELRMAALHLAVHVDTARVAASHGLDFHSDPVGTAQSFLSFLKGA